jgi:phosphoglycerate dehydrogenase-like enzyme
MRIDVETFGLDLEWPPVDGWVIDPCTTVNKGSLWETLEIIATASTGTNHIDLDACTNKGIDVLSLLDDKEGLLEIRASSEFTFFLILAALRRVKHLAFDMWAGKWDRHENVLRGRELYGKRVGIIGLGRIGSNIFRWATAFGANVGTIYDLTVRGTTLEMVFEDSDIVVISCALNEGVLVNTSRGEVVRESELVEILRVRPDVVYATDVLRGETTGEHLTSPLLGLTNCIVTPHVAGLTYESNEKALRIANKLLWRWYERSKKESV